MSDLTHELAKLAAVVRRDPQLEYLNPTSGFFQQLDAQRVDDSDVAVGIIAERLKARGTLADFESRPIRRSPSGSEGFSYRRIAHWMLAQARRRDASEVVQQFDRFVADNMCEFDEVIALWGITPEEAVEIHTRVTLAPLSLAAQPSSVKDQLTGVPYGPYSGGTSFAAPRPGAVLIKPTMFGPIFQSGKNAGSSMSIDELRSIAKCLCLVVDQSVCEIASWYQVNVDTPIIGGVLGWSGQAAEHVFHTPVPQRPIDALAAREIISSFLNLSPVVRKRLELPLERLNGALRRNRPADVALELGIALEAMLTGNEPHDAPIAYRVRQRATVLLGGTPDDRQRHFGALKVIYDLRSKAAHGADLPKHVTVRGRSVLTTEVLHNGTKLCAEIVRQIIRRGDFPDWDGMLLGW